MADAETAPVVGCSPHTRGWSQVGEVVLCGALVLPAHAGVVPGGGSGGRSGPGASPHTRGWSRGGEVGLQLGPVLPATGGWSRRIDRYPRHQAALPAPAGMAPRKGKRSCDAPHAPRDCGVEHDERCIEERWSDSAMTLPSQLGGLSPSNREQRALKFPPLKRDSVRPAGTSRTRARETKPGRVHSSLAREGRARHVLPMR